jgi:hypothetical protein
LSATPKTLALAVLLGLLGGGCNVGSIGGDGGPGGLDTGDGGAVVDRPGARDRAVLPDGQPASDAPAQLDAGGDGTAPSDAPLPADTAGPDTAVTDAGPADGLTPDVPTGLWFGWDPDSLDSPPDLTVQPGLDSTGLPPGTNLSVVNGDYHTSADGEVVDQVDISGTLHIDHRNVIVKRCRVRGFIRSSLGRDDRSTRIWACIIGRENPGNVGGSGIDFYPLEVKRCNMFGYVDLIHPGTGNDSTTTCTWRDNFMHDVVVVFDSFFNGDSHSDLIQLEPGAGHIDIHHNTLLGWGFYGRVTPPETCTATSGPHWGDETGATAYGYSGTASPSNGVITDGIILNAAGTTGKQITTIDLAENWFMGKPFNMFTTSQVTGDQQPHRLVHRQHPGRRLAPTLSQRQA